jgi:hypothetical protein
MQGRRGKTALVWVLGSTVVRFLDLVQGEKRNFGNRGGALLVTYRARIDCGKRASWPYLPGCPRGAWLSPLFYEGAQILFFPPP